jgi:hypothetical protein
MMMMMMWEHIHKQSHILFYKIQEESHVFSKYKKNEEIEGQE